MPVKRQGRFTIAKTDELREWLGKEAHMPAPAHVLPENAGEVISAAPGRIHLRPPPQASALIALAKLPAH